jgi:hypothetical protein
MSATRASSSAIIFLMFSVVRLMEAAELLNEFILSRLSIINF